MESRGPRDGGMVRHPAQAAGAADHAVCLALGVAAAGVFLPMDALFVWLVLCGSIYTGAMIVLGDFRLRSAALVLFAGAAGMFPAAVFLVPAVICAHWKERERYLLFLVLPGFIRLALAFGPACALLLAVSAVAARLIKHRLTAAIELQHRRNDLDDEVHLTRSKLAGQRRELLRIQEKQVQLATLAERARIARDIHDQVGHLLSRALLRIGAFKIERGADTGLDDLEETIDAAMTSIRTSVHSLHDTAVDLETVLRQAVADFDFCTCELTVDLGSAVPKPIKIHVIFVVQEALSNIAKHSRATKAEIRLKEHPGFYQLVIRDDGANFQRWGSGLLERFDLSDLPGLGLRSIAERVRELGGQLNIQTQRGFQIFISLPKDGTYEAHLH